MVGGVGSSAWIAFLMRICQPSYSDTIASLVQRILFDIIDSVVMVEGNNTTVLDSGVEYSNSVSRSPLSALII